MNNRGFTLIELMIAVAIIGILAAIAWPNYTDYRNKAGRSDATNALTGLQMAQEKARGNCRYYAQTFDTDDECLATAAASTVNFPSSSTEGWYTLGLSDASSTGYTATATANAGGRQFGDTNCRKLILTVSPTTPNGAKTSEDASGNDTTGECW